MASASPCCPCPQQSPSFSPDDETRVHTHCLSQVCMCPCMSHVSYLIVKPQRGMRRDRAQEAGHAGAPVPRSRHSVLCQVRAGFTARNLARPGRRLAKR